MTTNQSSFVELVSAELNKQIMAARERDRNRIAQAIHAEPLQVLCSILNELNSAPPDQPLTKRETFALDLCYRAYNHLSFLEHEERAEEIEHVGLAAFLFDLSFAMGKHYKQAVEVEIQDSLGDARYDIELETALYRIAQNAVYNSVKHGQASVIKINLTEKAGVLHLVIEDNGKGFDASKATIAKLVERGHHGLSDMTSYAAAFGGQLSIKSRPGAGTHIEAHVPTKPHQARPDPFERPELKRLIRQAQKEARENEKLAKVS